MSMRKALFATAVAGALLGLGGGSAVYASDNSTILFDCNGTIDVACYYYPGGRKTFCTLWYPGRCYIG